MPARLLALAVCLLLPATASAAVLIEARERGEALRLVVDWQASRVLVERPDGRHLVDLEGGWIYQLGPGSSSAERGSRPETGSSSAERDSRSETRSSSAQRGSGPETRSSSAERGSRPETGRTAAFLRPGYEEPPPWRLDVFGPGPIRAGHATTYHVLFLGDEVCAEVLASPWMIPFTDLGVQALALLDRLKGEPEPEPVSCADAPLTTLGAAGWPLLVGKVDRPTLETRAIRFDYRPPAGELAIPAPFGEPAASVQTPN